MTVVPEASPVAKAGGLDSFLESAVQEILVVTYWFDPAPNTEPYTAVIRFSGQRVGVTGRRQPRDQFVQDETIEVAAPAAGRVSVTARVRGVSPGEWAVTAKMLSPGPNQRSKKRGRGGPAPAGPSPSALHRAAWSWRRWRLGEEEPAGHVHTCLVPFAPVPGLIPGVWAGTAVAGILLGLVLQAVLVAHARMDVGHAVLVSVLAIITGVIGAKVWFMVLHWRERLMNGWCIQGLLTGVVVILTGGSLLFHLSLGALLDATAPGLLLGMAVGRVGCFFAGCCSGRPSAAFWALWSTDQRVGVRRIPTQLMESLLALAVGLASLVAFLAHGPADGAIFLATAAGYTLARQGILLLRSEGRKSVVGPPLTAAAAALLLVADLALVALSVSGRISLPTL